MRIVMKEFKVFNRLLNRIQEINLSGQFCQNMLTKKLKGKIKL